MDLFSSAAARRSPTSTDSSTLIAFYEETGLDARGRRLSDILRWNEHKLESSHDYIQTLFPLPERSGVNDRAPIIDRHVFEAFRSRGDLRDKLRDSLRKILWFYGFQLEKNAEDGRFVVRQGHNYPAHSQNWLTRFDHNHLRITRIIRCLRVLGLEDEALAFYDVISGATVVSSRSRMYWARAAFRPLNIRPDVEEDVELERMGPKFLREFEQRKQDQAREASGVENEMKDEIITDSGPQAQNGVAVEFEKMEKDGAEISHPISGYGRKIEPSNEKETQECQEQAQQKQ